MFRFVVLVAFLATAAFADDVARQCVNSAGALPASFQVEGCASAPCALPQLEDAVIKVKFNAPRSSESLRTQLVLYLFTIPIQYDLGTDSQACNGLANASCPVKEGQELEYTLKLPIQPYFPIGTSVSFEVQVFDDANSPAFCARIPVVIVAPRNQNEDTVQVAN